MSKKKNSKNKYSYGSYSSAMAKSKSKIKSRRYKGILYIMLLIILLACVSFALDKFSDKLPFRLPWKDKAPVIEISQVVGMDIPEYEESPYVIIDDNIPDEFGGAYDKKDYELGVHFSSLDSLGRTGSTWGVLDASLMPTVGREETLDTKPSGWNPAKYDGIIEDGFLYNRCHLIGYQLTGENDNPLNLITGTRYFNVEGMLPFENRVAGYIRREEGRVFYRVTPLYRGNELVCRYVRMEAFSLDDRGAGISFDVLIYNVQPGVEIDYSDGSSRLKR